MNTETRGRSASGLLVDDSGRMLPLSLPGLGIVSPPTQPHPVAEEVLRAFRMHGYYLIHWQESWLVFSKDTEGRYRRVNESDDRTFLTNALRMLLKDSEYEEPDGQGSFDLKKWNPTSQRVNEVSAAIKSYVTVSADRAAGSWLDATTEAVNPGHQLIVCRNGLLDTSVFEEVNGIVTHKLLPHSPRFLSEVSVDLLYDPTADCVEWLKFLDSVWENDPDSIATLQEIMGLLISGETRVQKAFMFIGPSRSGKGTIARIIEALQGGADRVDHPTLQRLGQPFGLAPMLGKRVGIVGDARTLASQAAIEMLLGISGGDVVSVNRKNKAELQVKLPIMFIIMSNQLPDLPDSSGALANRFIPLRMTKSWLGNEDLELQDKLLKELPGILNWALEGLRRLRGNNFKFTMSALSQEQLESLKNNSSPETRFVIEKRYEISSRVRIEQSVLYLAWTSWAASNGIRPGSKAEFENKLTAAFPSVRPRRLGPRGEQVWYFEGIGIGQVEV